MSRFAERTMSAKSRRRLEGGHDQPKVLNVFVGASSLPESDSGREGEPTKTVIFEDGGMSAGSDENSKEQQAPQWGCRSTQTSSRSGNFLTDSSNATSSSTEGGNLMVASSSGFTLEEVAAQTFALARSHQGNAALDYARRDSRIAHCKDGGGHTLLHWACLCNLIPLARYLIEVCRVDVNAASLNGQTPLMWATMNEHIMLMNYLLGNKDIGIDLKDSKGASALILAIQHGKTHAILVLQHYGADFNTVDANGATAAHWAAFRGDADTLRFLDYFEVNFNGRDRQGMLPLHMAALAERFEACKYLMGPRHNQDPHDKATKDQERPLDLLMTRTEPNPYLVRLLQSGVAAKSHKTSLEAHSDDDAGGKDGADTAAAAKEVGESAVAKILGQNKAGHPILAPLAPLLLKQDQLLPLFTLMIASFFASVWLTHLRSFVWKSAEGFPVFAYSTVGIVEVGGILSILVFGLLALGDPGVQPKRRRPRSVVEEIQRSLVSPSTNGSELAAQLDLSRVCRTCWVRKDLRTKHCSDCDTCVLNFDHHCVWLRNCIGKRNHRLFVLWLALCAVVQFVHFAACTWALVRHFSEAVNTRASPSYFPFLENAPVIAALFFTILSLPCTCLAETVHGLSFVWILLLLWSQIHCIAKNITANETISVARYNHFWRNEPFWTPEGVVMRRRLRNPFDVGVVRNCIEFWLGKRCGRLQLEPTPGQESGKIEMQRSRS